jgi:Uma2 family endonuclease
MAAPVRQHYFTPAEYLAQERKAEYKSEYIAGQMVAMSGASRVHNLISGNLARVLGSQLLDRPCEVYASDMRVKVTARGMYTYPDTVVVCGDAQFEDEQVDTLLNPTVIVEALSTPTEAYDRGAKFEYYRQLPSLREYILVAQEQILIEHFVREDEGWLLTETTGPGELVQLPSIACALPVAEVYRKVVFEADPNAS